MCPFDNVGQTEDIFIFEHSKTLYWKRAYDGNEEDQWCIAYDDDITCHPTEPGFYFSVMVRDHSSLYCTKLTISLANVTCDIIEELGQLFKVSCDL